jgi:hypothetical protein
MLVFITHPVRCAFDSPRLPVTLALQQGNGGRSRSCERQYPVAYEALHRAYELMGATLFGAARGPMSQSTMCSQFATGLSPALFPEPVRFGVISGHFSMSRRCPLFPQKRTLRVATRMSALCQMQTFCAAAKEECRYSITSSALTISVCGTVRPSDFAVLRFRTSLNLVDCSTGRSAGFAPFSILSV